jgi:hypothetical protein
MFVSARSHGRQQQLVWPSGSSSPEQRSDGGFGTALSGPVNAEDGSDPARPPGGGRANDSSPQGATRALNGLRGHCQRPERATAARAPVVGDTRCLPGYVTDSSERVAVVQVIEGWNGRSNRSRGRSRWVIAGDQIG